MGTPEFWDAVNAYAQACGGDTSAARIGTPRMEAVVGVERALEHEKRAALKCVAERARAAEDAGDFVLECMELDRG